jgi:hypothetical protein
MIERGKEEQSVHCVRLMVLCYRFVGVLIHQQSQCPQCDGSLHLHANPVAVYMASKYRAWPCFSIRLHFVQASLSPCCTRVNRHLDHQADGLAKSSARRPLSCWYEARSERVRSFVFSPYIPKLEKSNSAGCCVASTPPLITGLRAASSLGAPLESPLISGGCGGCFATMSSSITLCYVRRETAFQSIVSTSERLQRNFVHSHLFRRLKMLDCRFSCVEIAEGDCSGSGCSELSLNGHECTRSSART